MRWRIAWVCALSLVGALGCPHSFGRGGTIEKAVHKDVQEMLDEEECSKEVYEENCVPDPTTEQCREACG